MKYNHIQRFLSAALLLAFTAPSSLTASAYDSASLAPYTSSMVLSGDVKLTPKNDKITLSLRDSDVKQVLRMFADYHVHTAFSDDSIYPMEQEVQDAISKKDR